MRWTVHSEKPLYKDEWLDIRVADVELPGGRHLEHRLVRTPPGAGCVVVRDGEALLLWRHRFITGSQGWEIPIGKIEPGEDPAAPEPNSLVPAAGVLAVDGLGRVLLQKRRDTGQWAIPMGEQELGESVTQCAVRETAEETGVTVEVTGLLGIYSDPGHVVYYDSDGETRQEVEIILLGLPASDQPEANDEASEAGWFTVADLEGLGLL